MKYLSICSGIEAATVAWHPLGWEPVGFADIDEFPRAVLTHHYPHVPLHSDFTQIRETDHEPIDLLVGGTPCQAFSIAGLRKGLGDYRGNLTLEYIRLAERSRPRWLVWENVPGVLSIDGGRTFGTFLGGLAECGYGFAFRVLDAQYFGVPQRRRRVFVIGYLGNWRPAASVLFERQSLQRDLAPHRKNEERIADCLTASANQCSGFPGNPVETNYPAPDEYFTVTDTLTSGGDAHRGFRNEQGLVAIPINTQNALREAKQNCANGFGIGVEGDPSFTLQAAHSHAVAYNVTFCDANGRRADRPNGGLYVNETDQAKTITSGGDLSTYVSGKNMAVRRLTPLECERLQGFQDEYTLIPYRNGMAPDRLRYKALGNSMAVPVMRWLGERIQQVDATIGK